MNSLKLNTVFYKYFIVASAFLLANTIYSQEKIDYYRFLDSAYIYNNNAEKSMIFLDSIPFPVEQYIPNALVIYYDLKGLAHDNLNQDIESYKSTLNQLKYAEIDKDYESCVFICISLFRISIDVFDDKESKPLEYIKKAEYYNNLAKDLSPKYTKKDIEQAYAYYYHVNKRFKTSNEILLKNITEYEKLFNIVGVFQMDANHMIACNYIGLDKIKDAYPYIKKFETSSKDTTIYQTNFYTFKSNINLNAALYFYRKNNNDSTLSYLNKVKPYVDYLDDAFTAQYYSLYADLYKEDEKLELAKLYLDSLMIFQQKMGEYNVIAGDKITTEIIKKEGELKIIKSNDVMFRLIVSFVILTLFVFSVFYFIRYRKGKGQLHLIEDQKKDVKYFKTSNAKLSAKIQGLEDYIYNLKIELKEISKLKFEVQRVRLQDLYKNLHVDANTISEKGDVHYDLMNELNFEFFKELNEKHPELSKKEIIICYYIFVGFTSKEIAVFLNTSVRSVESKRYRISKKMDLKSKKLSLASYLKHLFKDSLTVT
ncbi:MAG: helix-turn-helix transcriptional regulator [Jejuia sp.]